MVATHPPQKVTVIGAGMVGLSTAWFLQEHGVQVEVIDREGVAAGSSWGNAGWLTPGLSTPLPDPDAECSASMSGTKGSVTLEDPSGTRVDAVGYGSVAIFEGQPAQALTNTTSASRTDGIDTDDNRADFSRGEPTPQGGGSDEPDPDPDPEQVTIAEIRCPLRMRSFPSFRVGSVVSGRVGERAQPCELVGQRRQIRSVAAEQRRVLRGHVARVHA